MANSGNTDLDHQACSVGLSDNYEAHQWNHLLSRSEKSAFHDGNLSVPALWLPFFQQVFKSPFLKFLGLGIFIIFRPKTTVITIFLINSYRTIQTSQ